MRGAVPSSSYHPRTPRQHQWILQLGRACDADKWVSRALRAERAPVLLAAIGTPDDYRHVLQITPRFLAGIRRIIFSRLIDLPHEGLGREAMKRVAVWRAARLAALPASE